MTKEEALKLQPGDKVVFTPRAEYGVYPENKRIDDEILYRQEKSGGFVVVAGIKLITETTIKISIESSYYPKLIAFHDEVNLYRPRFWSYELDY